MRLIYIVDDDKIYHYTSKVLINRLDPNSVINHYYDGKSSLEALNKALTEGEQTPEIILLDINMPDVNGWEFIEAYKNIKHNLRQIPEIYVVSSSIDPNDMKKAKSIPEITAYLTKPLSMETIANLLKLNTQ